MWLSERRLQGLREMAVHGRVERLDEFVGKCQVFRHLVEPSLCASFIAPVSHKEDTGGGDAKRRYASFEKSLTNQVNQTSDKAKSRNVP